MAAASDRRGGGRWLSRRAEVLDAAAAVFSAKGYHGASTKQIADAIGLKQGSLYYYFSSKEEALREVCEAGVAGFLQGLLAIRAGEAPLGVKLRAAIANHLEPVRDRRDYVRVFLRDRRHLTAASRRTLATLVQAYEAAMEAILTDAQARGELSAGLDTRMATLAILGMCNAAAGWYGREPNAGLERIVGAFTMLVTHGLAPEALRGVTTSV